MQNLSNFRANLDLVKNHESLRLISNVKELQKELSMRALNLGLWTFTNNKTGDNFKNLPIFPLGIHRKSMVFNQPRSKQVLFSHVGRERRQIYIISSMLAYYGNHSYSRSGLSHDKTTLFLCGSSKIYINPNRFSMINTLSTELCSPFPNVSEVNAAKVKVKVNSNNGLQVSRVYNSYSNSSSSESLSSSTGSNIDLEEYLVLEKGNSISCNTISGNTISCNHLETNCQGLPNLKPFGELHVGTLGEDPGVDKYTQETGPCCKARRVFDGYILQEAYEDVYLWAAAWLRAESHCEGQPFVRYVDSFKKRFAEQEFIGLKKRIVTRYGRSLKCICFVAVSSPPEDITEGTVQHGTALQTTLGTLDLSLRQLSPWELMPGVQIQGSNSISWQSLWRLLISQPLSEGEESLKANRKAVTYGYIANVCVQKKARRRGIAYGLLLLAIEAAKDWGLKELYCHVDVGNKPAYNLYIQTGFEAVGENGDSEGLPATRAALEQTALMRLLL